MKKWIVFSRSTSRWNYSENWSFEKQFDDPKYAHMWIDIQKNGLNNKDTEYCVAEFDLPVIPAKPADNVSKIA